MDSGTNGQISFKSFCCLFQTDVFYHLISYPLRMSEKRSSSEPVYPSKKRALLAQWQIDNQSNIYAQQNELVNNLSGYHGNNGVVAMYQKAVTEEVSSGSKSSLSVLNKLTNNDIVVVKETSPNSDQSPPSYKTPERNPLSGRNYLKQISKPLFPPCYTEKQPPKNFINVVKPNSISCRIENLNSGLIGEIKNKVTDGRNTKKIMASNTHVPVITSVNDEKCEPVVTSVNNGICEPVVTSVNNEKYRLVTSVNNEKCEPVVSFMNEKSNCDQNLSLQISKEKFDSKNLNDKKTSDNLKTDILKKPTGYLKESSSSQNLNIHGQNSPKYVSNIERSGDFSRATDVSTTCKNYVCKVCNLEVHSQNELNSHMKQHRDLITCWKCGENFHSAEKLCLHMKVEHKGDNPYKCDTCGREFTQYNNLRRHLRVHRENLYKCNLCDREFNEKFYLRMHMSTHTGNRVYSCGICRAEFPSNHDLKMHVKSHSPSLLHTCNVCGKSFSKACVLRQHKKCHSGDRPHKCTICVKTFIHRHHLTMHLKSHNEDERKPMKVVKETSDNSKGCTDADFMDEQNEDSDFQAKCNNKENLNPVCKKKEKASGIKYSKRNLSEQFLKHSTDSDQCLQDNKKMFNIPHMKDKDDKKLESSGLSSISVVQNFDKRMDNPNYSSNHCHYHGNSLMKNIGHHDKPFYSGSPLPMYMSNSVSPYLNYYNQYAGQFQLYMNNLLMMNYLSGKLPLPHSYQGQGHPQGQNEGHLKIMNQNDERLQGHTQYEGEFHSTGHSEAKLKDWRGQQNCQTESNSKGHGESHRQGQCLCNPDKNIPKCEKSNKTVKDGKKQSDLGDNITLCETGTLINCDISATDKEETRMEYISDEKTQNNVDRGINHEMETDCHNQEQNLPKPVQVDKANTQMHDIRVNYLKLMENGNKMVGTSPKQFNVVNAPDIEKHEVAKEMIKLSKGLRSNTEDNCLANN
ncbi:hypothetical protein ACF0H5_024172 [Mactra antiquata]